MVTVLCLVAPELRPLVEALWCLVSSEIVKQNSAISSVNCVMNGADGRSRMLENVICALSVQQTFLVSSEIVKQNSAISPVNCVRSGAHFRSLTMEIVTYARSV